MSFGKFVFWLNVVMSAINIGDFLVSGGVGNLVIGLLNGYCAFITRNHA